MTSIKVNDYNDKDEDNNDENILQAQHLWLHLMTLSSTPSL